MLDVHPPEHTPHSWRDFFIHIATIVLGLLIAIGLEQTVEWLRHRHETLETRQRIREELVEDRRGIEINMTRLHQDDARLAADGSILSRDRLPPASLAELHYSWDLVLEPNAAWEIARQSQIFSLMPAEETQQYAYFYRLLSEDYAVSVQYIAQINDADAIVKRAAAEHALTAVDRQRLLTTTDELRGKIANQLQLYAFLDQALNDWLSKH